MIGKLRPHINIVGAGPGDPELLTLKGLKALQQSTVILYDALVNPKMLEYAKKGTIKVFVGKRAGYHQFPQNEINKLLIYYAKKYGCVTRLKGGDPFVFGRGHEELSFIKKHRISVQVIPGVSSCIAVPELHGIPLTSRGISNSFWVLTGSTESGKFSEDLIHASKSNASLVILMGLKKLDRITQLFIKQKKNNLPIAIIQDCTGPNEKFISGEINNICTKAREHDIQTPAIILIGNVVKLHQEAKEKKSLSAVLKENGSAQLNKIF